MNPFRALRTAAEDGRRLLASGLAGIRSPGFEGDVHFDPARFVWRDSAVYNGFPLGGIGTGAVGVATDGGFLNLTTNNNWMRPVPPARGGTLRHVRGSFLAVSCSDSTRRVTRILRRKLQGTREYNNLEPIQQCTFFGRLPCFEQHFRDPALPVEPTVRGFVPLVPQDLEHSSLPVAVFRVELRNTSTSPLDVSVLFSWQNMLGLGGTGETGVALKGGRPVGLHGRTTFNKVAGNFQRPCDVETDSGLLRGLRFATAQDAGPRDAKRSTLGQYLLACEETDSIDISRTEVWDAGWDSHRILSQFALTGRIESWQSRRQVEHPAGAICAHTHVAPGEVAVAHFYLAWWLPDHTTDVRAGKRDGEHDGVNVGHVYENFVDTAEDAVAKVHSQRGPLLDKSRALHDLIDRSTLPGWLGHALINASDSVVTNTVVPRSGDLYTIEGAGWRWFFGGLTGTADQRLAAHPYAATFYPELDRTELDTFRRLSVDGRVPHGNGNCDLALNSAEVPYGWPLRLTGALGDDDWPDLTLSIILQTFRGWRMGLPVESAASDLFAMGTALHEAAFKTHGIPAGGSTFDTWSFPGTFAYTATLYIAAMDALAILADALNSDTAERWRLAAAAARQRTEQALWRGFDGYYRACEDRDTLFMGSMAGVWFAEWAGLPSPLPEAHVRSHMERQHRLLMPWMPKQKQRAAFPVVEVSAAGKPVKNRVFGMEVAGYAWQMLAYHGLVLMRHGNPAGALDMIRDFYLRMWRGGWPWSADLYGNAGPNYMTHGVLWSLPNLLAGAALDVPGQHLTLKPVAPRLLGEHLAAAGGAGGTASRWPVVFPAFWGLLEVQLDGTPTRLDVVRHFGDPVAVTHLTSAAGRFELDDPWILRSGTSLALPSVAGFAP